MAECKIKFRKSNDQDIYTLSINGEGLHGRMSSVENDLGFLEEGNVFGVQYELGGSSGSKILELKKLVICAERTVVCVNLGKMESIVARDEDLVHGCSKLHESILDIFQNTDNTFVGFNLHVLKYHLSALGINIGAAFIDLAKEKGIRNWEKGVTDLIGFKKITHSDSSIIGRLSAVITSTQQVNVV